jgi:hypothetical protein
MGNVPTGPDDPIARVLARAEAGDAAAKKALFATLYDELHARISPATTARHSLR